MPRFKHFPPAAVALLAALSCTVSAAESFSGFQHCVVEGSGGATRRYADCATLTRPENPKDPHSQAIDLTVARAKAPAAQQANDALVVINGGPGGSSIELLADFWQVFAALGTERDVLAMDQRGTGRSNRLACPELMADSPEAADDTFIDKAVDDCLTGLDADTRYYTTSIAVQDLEALRIALGYDRLTIYGVSYGTRVAQHYLRRYPDRVRAVILDGVVPPDEPLLAPVIEHSDKALNTLIDRCVADDACVGALGDVRAQLAEVRSYFDTRERVPVHFMHPVTAAPANYDVTYEHFASLIRFLLYAPESAATVPLLIRRAAEEKDFAPVAAQALLTLQRLGDSLASGMHNSVMCTEDQPFARIDDETFAALDRTYLTAALVDGVNAYCKRWPAGVLDDDLREPVRSDVPALVLSGEFDPITPPAWGEKILPGLSNSRHLVAPGQGHGVIGRGCVPKLAAQFISDLDAQALDTTCLDTLAPFPFFIDVLGPAP